MGWGAILGAFLALALEIIKIIRDVKAENKEEAIELKKQKTEVIQSLARGIIDRDASRINSDIDRLRRLRENK